MRPQYDGDKTYSPGFDVDILGEHDITFFGLAPAFIVPDIDCVTGVSRAGSGWAVRVV